MALEVRPAPHRRPPPRPPRSSQETGVVRSTRSIRPRPARRAAGCSDCAGIDPLSRAAVSTVAAGTLRKAPLGHAAGVQTIRPGLEHPWSRTTTCREHAPRAPPRSRGARRGTSRSRHRLDVRLSGPSPSRGSSGGAADAVVGEAEGGHPRGVVEVAAVEDDRLRGAGRAITSKSGLRNSFHSVTIARASACFEGAVGAVAVGRAGRRRSPGRWPSPRGRGRGACAPAASSASIRTSAGASRMSSVRGLKARPQMATVLPCELAAEVVEDLVGRGRPSGPR